MVVLIIAAISLAAWVWLALAHHRFWRTDIRLLPSRAPAQWPPIAAIVPARNEAATIARIVEAHLTCDYPGPFHVVVVDDNSSDGTGQLAKNAAASALGALAADKTNARAFTLASAGDLPTGWSGKLNAVQRGIETAQPTRTEADNSKAHYLLLTDADIQFAPSTLRHLVAKAEAEELKLVSLMARLDSRGLWGAMLIPAFVYFFQKLYPFSASNDPTRELAAAAGGCLLVDAKTLAKAGGINAVRHALIDDCAIADLIKNGNASDTERAPRHKIWLGLADREALSLRDNRPLGSIWTMVARTAYTQLGYSPLALIGTFVGMLLIYVAPPAITLIGVATGNGIAGAVASAAWIIMAMTYVPMTRHYGVAAPFAFALPVAGLLYALMTFDSARRHIMGRGGQWKGRTYSSGGPNDPGSA